MNKIAYEIVSLEVEKISMKEIDLDNADQLNDQCFLIDEFIKACGWDVDDYWERWVNVN